ncbi:MAG: UvrD-helicase domain-containing protein, partial [Lachnospiraceae bacterium]|nr:UvrD-helicase domain-containing protein [Lachnospiraceae bacterium]
TNKDEWEMKKRIRALLGYHNDTSLICTYHGFCNRLLRENPEKLFLNKQFQIIDAQQQKAILGEIYQKFELKLDYASFESILRKIGYVKKDTGYVTRLCNPRPCRILDEIKDQDDQIVEEFLQRQKATYSLDFHDLISFAIYLLETDAEVREKWQSRLNYIMVDEFQDSSAVEMRLVEILSGMFQNLMIVGDPDQNIYEWRGSDVRLLVDFDREHEPTKTIILNQNYRSTPQILNCANTLIEKNELRLKKDLFTKNAAGAPVVHYHSKNDFEEMDRVIENIKRLHEKEGLKYSDFAVLYRSGFLSRVAEKKLVEKNIPYEIFGGVRFYQRMEILDVVAYLKLIAYDDDVSFRRIVNTPRRRFGRAKMNLLEKLREQEAANGAGSIQGRVPSDALPGNGVDGTASSSLFAALSAHLDEREFLNSDAASFVRFVEAMRESCRTKRISDIVNEVTKDSGYEGYIRELGDEERLDNLAEFKRIANEFEREFGENLTLEQFLQQIALQSGEDAAEAKDTVKLMTIHSSKGLEFPAVFILGFTEGVFPSAKTIGERKKLGLEEERRLCYVAITRAEKYLFLLDSEGTSPNGIKKLVSRFLEEIGEENYVRVGQISDELQKESRGYAAKLNSEIGAEENTGGKKAGDVVEHHIFGRGTIEAVDEKRGSYLVRFEGMKQPRNISGNYFAKEHEDARQKQYTERAGSEIVGQSLPAQEGLPADGVKGAEEVLTAEREKRAGEGLPVKREEIAGECLPEKEGKPSEVRAEIKALQALAATAAELKA